MSIEKLSQMAEIVIGLATIYSLFLSRKALSTSNWNSALSTVPSLIIRPQSISVEIGPKASEMGFYTPDVGSKIEAIKFDDRNIVFKIIFEIFNAGRGAAFNLKKPKIIGQVIYNDGYRKTPLHQSLEDKPFNFSITVIKSFNEWVNCATEKSPLAIEIHYTNDQGNINCVSSWSAELQPFKLEGSSLIVKEERVLNRNTSVTYTPKK